MRLISLRIPEELHAEISRVADETGSAFSDVARLALLAFITNDEARRSQSGSLSTIGLCQLLGLTQVIAEQLDSSSIERAHDIAISFATRHGLTQADITDMASQKNGGHK